MLEDEDRRRQHIEEEAVEVQRHPERQQQEARVAEDRQVGAQQRQRMQRLAVLLGERLGQEAPGHPREHEAEQGQEEEDRPPAREREQARADQGCQRRCEREDQHHPRHQALRLRPLVQVAHHRASDHDPRSAAQTLQRAPDPEPLDARCQRAHQRGERKHHGQRDQHAAAAEAVGEGAMPEHHGGERGHVDRQGLLHLQLAGAERRADRGEGGQIGVDRERADRGQGGQQRGEAGMGERSGHVRLEADS